MRQNLYRYADVLLLHPTSSGHWRNDTGADVEYPDQSDREPVGNDDWDCIDKIKSHFLTYRQDRYKREIFVSYLWGEVFLCTLSNVPQSISKDHPILSLDQKEGFFHLHILYRVIH